MTKGDSLKRVAFLAVVVGAIAALPGSASARSDCSYAGGGPVAVYTDGGVTPAGDAILGVCVDAGGSVGGYGEVGSNGTNHYAVIDGHDGNPGASAGYGGIVTGYETGAQDQCSPNVLAPSGTDVGDDTDEGSGTNQGGCFSVRGGNSSGSPVLVSVPLVPLACGNTSGADWTSASRDGCTVP
jgi:hypothetical protein